jgi:hypothetical protein
MAPDWTWKLVFFDDTEWTDRDGPPEMSPVKPVWFAVQPGKDPEIVGLNADWLLWRRDLSEWSVCGADGFADHAQWVGHLIGCWRKTWWGPLKEFHRVREREAKVLEGWARGRKELEQ